MEKEERIKLYILGLSYSQTQTGAYALVLAEEKGKRRLPIIIGAPEAQSIAIQLEGLKPARPLTHDLFLSFAETFKITMKEVEIYKLEEGVFYSRLICSMDQTNYFTIDARTSDAVALSLRFRCPVYTSQDIMKRAGIILEFEGQEEEQEVNTDPLDQSTYADMSVAELEERLNEAIEAEKYEQASVIRDEIQKRKQSEQ